MTSEPLRQKLVRQFTLQAGFVILLASALFAVNDVRVLRTQLEDKLLTASDVVSANVASSLVFDDADSATVILGSFRAEPMVLNAWLFEGDDIFASYGEADGARAALVLAETAGSDSQVLGRGELSLIRVPVRAADGDIVGNLLVEARLDVLGTVYQQYGSIFLVVFGIGVAIILILARNLSRQITGQLTRLVETAREISTTGDYTARASERTSSQITEIDQMAREFDLMIGEIKDREAQLTQAKTGLEDKVRERTQQIADSERNLRQVMDAVPHLIYAKDAEGRFILVNKAAAAILDLPIDRIIGRTDEELGRPAAECRRAREEDGDVLRTRAPLTIPQVEIPGSDGTVHNYQITKLPYVPAGAEDVAVLGIGIDITERLRIDGEKRRIEDKMRHTQKLESLGVLAGGIAHDFNNLLMVIMGHTELALTRTRDTERVTNSLRQIDQASRRASDLTNQMLAYSGKGKFVVQNVEVDRLVLEMMDLLRSVISKSARLSFSTTARRTVVRADPSQLNQVVMNLITNASDAVGEAEGDIRISLENVTGSDIDLGTGHSYGNVDVGRDYVAFSVADTGSGMDESTVSRIFEPFFTTKFVGRGLGLAAVVGIVRSHEGAMAVDTREGHGSTFTVWLPLEVDTADDEPEPADGSRTPPGGVPAIGGEGTVLVIDDEPEVLDVASDILESFGFRTVKADGGRAGIEALSGDPSGIDVVLLDMSMPSLDGPATCEELRKIRPDIPVVFCSGYSEEAARDHFSVADEGAFIQKPYSAKGLASRIREVLAVEGAPPETL